MTVSSLLLLRDDRLVGIVTDRDLRNRVVADGRDAGDSVASVMTTDPVTASPDDLAFEVLMEMVGRAIHHLPVVDDGHLLVNRYTGSGNAAGFAGANITDPTGVILTTPALDELLELQPVGANLVYASRRNTIFDTVSGDPVWDSLAPHASDMPLGAVVGNDVWFVSGSTIRVEPR